MGVTAVFGLGFFAWGRSRYSCETAGAESGYAGVAVGMRQGRFVRLGQGGPVTKIIMIVYLVVGVIVASSQGYLGEIGGVDDVLNLLLAIVLWPLLLVGVDFKIKIGNDNGGNRDRNGFLPLAGPAVVYLRARAGSIRGKLTDGRRQTAG
jgi:hypothetical protein